MARIDRETVERILDTADIVEVVGDFVSLRRQGTSYRGLCPFHADRNPSFSVSRAKGVYKCFSCGASGGIVSFLMNLEKMTYTEAIRYLGKKYGIEIQERELTGAEKQADADREAMIALNDFALNTFSDNLKLTDEGRTIGLSYFRERGINDAMIERFHLGYAMERSTAFYDKAKAKGFTEKYLIDTGLCIKNDSGRVYDRFKGRVIYPVHSVSGRVVAFGGRTLSSDKKIAKYVNSPESLIYSKSNELYGFYQAKNAIAKAKKCIMVEGYMDVISMHQSGVENVVASSGTSLTEGQIRLIKRFCNEVTLIYDADAAGVKASLRGIGMLLAAGMNVKTLHLPEGEDPDSFAQSHSAAELEEYLATHETDFIEYMSEALLKDAGHDPTRRAAAINEIVGTLAIIPDDIVRMVYISDCARRFEMKEDIIVRQVAKKIYQQRDAMGKQRMLQEAADSINDIIADEQASRGGSDVGAGAGTTATTPPTASATPPVKADYLLPFEKALLRYVLKYGMMDFCTIIDGEGHEAPLNVLDYIKSELDADSIVFTTPLYRRTMEEVTAIAATDWPGDSMRRRLDLERESVDAIARGEEEIRNSNLSSTAEIEKADTAMRENVAVALENAFREYSKNYIARRLLASEDDSIRNLTADLVADKHVLSKVHTKYAHVESEEERLVELLSRAVYELRDAIVAERINELQRRLAAVAPNDSDTANAILQQIINYHNARAEYAKCLGERIVLPPIK